MPAAATANLDPVIGLMAGTSMDGIDAALIHTDGVRVEKTGTGLTIPYSGKTRAMLDAVLSDTGNLAAMTADAIHIKHAALARRIAAEHAKAAIALMQKTKTRPAYIGFHGQTILHAPGRGISVQLGDADLLAGTLRLPVVHDFRGADIAAGGEGAPLAPIYHRALMESFALTPPCAIVNIGGIANISLWDGETLHGFDCGAGNVLMDMAMTESSNGKIRYDENGALAAQGKPDAAWLAAIMACDFFAPAMRRKPKSLDRRHALDMLRAHPLPQALSPADSMASLAAFTATAIALHCGGDINHVVVCGGGARNATLMKMLRARLPDSARLTRMEDHGAQGDFIEAELMAYLAARSRRDLPITFPATTGVAAPITGGVQISASESAT